MKATPGPLEWHPKAQDTEPVTVPGGPNLNLVPGAGGEVQWGLWDGVAVSAS